MYKIKITFEIKLITNKIDQFFNVLSKLQVYCLFFIPVDIIQTVFQSNASVHHEHETLNYVFNRKFVI